MSFAEDKSLHPQNNFISHSMTRNFAASLLTSETVTTTTTTHPNLNFNATTDDDFGYANYFGNSFECNTDNCNSTTESALDIRTVQSELSQSNGVQIYGQNFEYDCHSSVNENVQQIGKFFLKCAIEEIR